MSSQDKQTLAEAEIESLEKAVAKAGAIKDTNEKARAYRESIMAAMKFLRQGVDELETIVDADIYFPSNPFFKILHDTVLPSISYIVGNNREKNIPPDDLD